ncbi:MAG: AAA domain-containing protein, partial [Bacteroidales bacterium]|nr:AAA domain-containing protein [Bacteroidales bacterium]
WIAGDKAGCYALADVVSEPLDRASFPESHLWRVDDTSELKAAINITHNLANNPILKDEVDKVKNLANLKVGSQGTNFSATEKEYKALLELAMKRKEDKRYWLYSPGEQARNWEEFYNDGIMGLGWDKLDDLKNYKSKEEIKEALDESYGGEGSKKNDTTANDEFVNVMQVGDVVIAKKGVYELLGYGVVASDYIYDANREEYKHIRKVKWELKGNWNVGFQMVTKALTDITPYETDDPNYNWYYERLLGIMRGVENDTIDDGNTNKMNFPLNTIFYGPPGTGKTYNTVLRAAEIIEDREIKDYEEALKIFNTNLHNQIEFITFHQNYSYEDFIQGIRPDTDNNEELTFEKRDGVFKKIADRALKNLREWENPKVQKKTFEEAFNEFILPMVEGVVEEIEVKMARVSYFITAVTDKSIDFRKASGGTAHTLSISTLGRMYEAESVLDIKGLTPYYAPLLDELLKIGKDSSDRKEFVQKKNYVIIIDEINRANISRVFGELITLIEPDKRSHGEIPLVAQLPSGDKFLVPSNLYIVGTMNTADKSIALLDIALRRRFEFEAMYPLYEIEGHEVNDAYILKKLNERIVSTKGYDFQIGHSFFMDSKEDAYCLVKRMNNKVIPLLLEYYMNDEKEVRSILQFALLKIDETSWPLRITGRE